MSLVVHHYYPLGSTNLGDHLVARAIRGAVGRYFGDVRFVDMPVNRRYTAGDRPVGLCGENLARTNAEADLVIVGGSNLLEPRKPRSSVSGGQWGVQTDVQSIRALRPPVMLLGMGTGSSFGKRIRPYQMEAREEVRLLHGKAFAAAVRDVTTVGQLAKIGVEVECVGCPVTFLTPAAVTAQDPLLPLFVSFPPPRIIERWGGRTFMKMAMEYVRRLVGRELHVVVTLHDTEDIEAARAWVPQGADIFVADNLDELVGRFQQCRGVVGFRLHAALLALGLGKPIIPVGVDWRGLAFVKTFGLEDLSIRAHRPAQLAKLERLTERLLSGDNELIGRLASEKRTFGEKYESFLSLAADRFRTIREKR